MSRAISEHAFIGDGRCGALVAADGAIDWMSAPRLDVPPFFAALLGDDANGVWRLRPPGRASCRARRYVGNAPVLETEFRGEGGAARVTDFFARNGRASQLVRLVESLSGAVPLRSEIIPRPDFGRMIPRIERAGDGAVHVCGAGDALALRSNVPLCVGDGMVASLFALRPGHRAWFTLAWHDPVDEPPPAIDVDAARESVLREAERWSSSLELPDLAPDAVARSAMVLRQLVYAPTGALWAAATTSLPERVGGDLNWDYRFSWVRDTAFAVWSFLEIGALDEAAACVGWLLRATAGRPADIQPCYAVDGRAYIPEARLHGLRGYRGSLPIRTGNAAAAQRQMDVFGEILVSAVRLEERGRPLSGEDWARLVTIADALHELWQRPGHGFWEERYDLEVFLGERTLTCVGLRAAARAAQRRGDAQRRQRYAALADRAEETIRKSFVGRDGTLVTSNRSRSVGGSSLWPIMHEVVRGDEPLAQRTVTAVERRLVRDGLMYRTPDDLHRAQRPREGAFLPCTGWLARAQARCGRLAQAKASFERLLATANDVGIFSEEYDVRGRRMIGNVPQAFTHAEVIMTAHELARLGVR